MADTNNTTQNVEEFVPFSREEIIKTLSFLVTAEYKFVKLYLQLAESIDDDEFNTQNLREMAEEDKQHAGVLLEMLQDMAPEFDLMKTPEVNSMVGDNK